MIKNHFFSFLAIIFLCQVFYGSLVEVVVNSSIYENILEELQQYCSDLEVEGYQVQISTWKLSGTTAEQLKNFLKTKQNVGLVGAFFIGAMPNCMFEYYSNTYGNEIFPCDLFFMDLNTNWIDSDNDGYYDTTEKTPNPEIWLGRIRTDNLSIMGDEITLLKNYFKKNHEYRTGLKTLQNRAFYMTTSDWVPYNYGYNLRYSYNDFNNFNDASFFTKSNYINYLQSGYASMLICAHSNATYHQLTSGNFYNTDISSYNPKIWFYNLFACSNCKYTVSNNMGSCYITTEDFGLSAVGSTKIGSMLSFQNFYYKLGQNNTIGEAYKYWFKTVGVYDKFWHYGMTLLGDPTLKLYPIGSPQNIQILNSIDNIEISWNKRTESELFGYDIYRSSLPKTNFQKINIKTSTDTVFIDYPQIKTTYYYYVTAVNSVTINSISNTFSNTSHPSIAISTYYQTSYGIIFGTITTEWKSEPVSHIVVELLSNSTYYSTITNELGFFIFDNLKHDIYTILPKSSECVISPSSITVNLFPNENKEINFKLNFLPIAVISLDKTSSTVPAKINFSAQESYDPDGIITEYLWNFGLDNSSISTNSVCSYVYETTGTFTVSLIVLDNLGLKSKTSTKQIYITSLPKKIKFEVSLSSYSIFNGQEITLKIKIIDENNNLIDSYNKSNIKIFTNIGKVVPENINITNGTYEGKIIITTELNKSQKFNLWLESEEEILYSTTINLISYSDSLSNIKIFPNPSKYKTYVKFINLPKNTKIKIFSIDGTFIKEITNNEPLTIWDMKDDNGYFVLPGTYICSVEDNNKVKKIKFSIIKLSNKIY